MPVRRVHAARGALAGAVAATVWAAQQPLDKRVFGVPYDDCDLLVCGSRGYGPVRRVLLGGVSSRVVRHSKVPVVVTPRGD